MELTCSRKLEFDAGHRVLGHEGKCANPHGHRYSVVIHARGRLDNIGRVIDFGVLKMVIGEWIDREWDHGFLLNQNDMELEAALIQVQPHKVYFMPFNPTAENIALYLGGEIIPDLLEGTGVEVVKVVVHETPNCSAEWTL